MSIVDTHAHFWDVERLDYPWIEAESPFDRSFHLEDYQRASAEVPVKRRVFVECDAHPRCSVAEAEWVAGPAALDPRIQAIAARVQLPPADAAPRLPAVGAPPRGRERK